MARKDDPVFNVKFVQLVESQACLWNYTHPGYSKKEEVQRAWQHVANEIKDTVRNCRERWRTIRSSFLRSLKLARTQTGRGKRKYYLSKYLQFLIPYTKSRSCHKQVSVAAGPATAGMVLRKPSTSTAATFLAGVGHLRMVTAAAAEEEEDETKESVESEGDTHTHMPLDVQVSEEEGKDHATHSPTSCLPLRLQSIKVEQQQQQHPHTLPQTQQQGDKIVAHQSSLVTLPATMAAALGHHQNIDNWTELAHWFKGSSHHHPSNNSGLLSHHKLSTPPPQPPMAATPAPAMPTPPPAAAGAGLCPSGGPGPDADYSFLISLHPYLKEMSGKQNRRFRQKVVGLIDNVLDNVDV